MRLIFALLMIICTGECLNLGITLPHIPWKPKFADRDNMKCPRPICNDKTTLDGSGWSFEDCCVCYANPSWEIPTDKTQPLQIEYYRRNGRAKLFNINSDEKSYLRIYHSNGFLTAMPTNMCDFKKIVKIELRHNSIFDIGDISCLLKLDTLDLSYNKITYISNKTFIGLKELRVLKVRYNNLQILEPATITGPSLQIFHADFSHNALRTIEVSNMISDNHLCEFDFSSNKIEEIINTNHFRIDPEKTYAGGIVRLTGNNFTKFIDFQKLGITDIAVLGKLMSYGFVMPDVKWDCDCHMEPYLELGEKIISKIWRDYFNITCWNPPEYRGQSIPDMVLKGHLDLLICNLTTKEKCPKNCYCFYQPKEHRTVVNCTNAGLTELPRYIPEKEHIILILKNNSITHLENRSYFNKLAKLDLTENSLESITPDAINSLPKEAVLLFENNNLKTLPRVVQTLDPCTAQFGIITAKCECGHIWIKDWLINMRAETCSNSTMYMCERDEGYIPVNEVSKVDLCPTELSYLVEVVFSVMCVLVIGISSFIYFLRYEIYLIKRKIFSRKSLNSVGLLHKYDAFVSFDENNLPIRSWILKVLSVNLSASGYRLFVPCRDLDIGSVKEEEILTKILCSRNFIIILSDNYTSKNTIWTGIEWKYIWHTFKANVDRNTIVINFDQLDTNDELDPRLRAFIRLGFDIDFSNRDHSLIQQVKNRLGVPRMFNIFNNRNRHTKFCTKHLRQKEYTVV